jgi:lysophospholipase L1-like esterase
MSLKKSDLLVCAGCGMYGAKDSFVGDSADTCKQCVRVGRLETTLEDVTKSLEEEKKRSLADRTNMEILLNRLIALEESIKKKPDEDSKASGKAEKKLVDMASDQKDQASKSTSSQRKKKKKVVLVGDSLVRHVGRNLQVQSSGFRSICKPGARISQLLPEIKKKVEPEATVLIQVGTNNLRMDETEVIMKEYEDLVKGVKEDREGEVVVMGILPRQDISDALESKRTDINRQLKWMCSKEDVKYWEVDFNPWKAGFLGSDGLHLNPRGADVVARQVFMMMKSLN